MGGKSRLYFDALIRSTMVHPTLFSISFLSSILSQAHKRKASGCPTCLLGMVSRFYWRLMWLAL